MQDQGEGNLWSQDNNLLFNGEDLKHILKLVFEARVLSEEESLILNKKEFK